MSKKTLAILMALVLTTLPIFLPIKTASAVGTIPNPHQYRFVSIGSPESLDPGWAYDTASGELMMQVYEPLIAYDHESTAAFVPVLAKKLPRVERVTETLANTTVVNKTNPMCSNWTSGGVSHHLFGWQDKDGSGALTTGDVVWFENLTDHEYSFQGVVQSITGNMILEVERVRVYFELRTNVHFHPWTSDIPGYATHTADEVTTEDVEWSFERGCVLDHEGGPMGLIMQPAMGIMTTREYDLDNSISDRRLVGHMIDNAFAHNNSHFWFNLVQTFPPFLKIITQSWASMYPKAWNIALMEMNIADPSMRFYGFDHTLPRDYESWYWYTNPAKPDEIDAAPGHMCGTGPYYFDYLAGSDWEIKAQIKAFNMPTDWATGTVNGYGAFWIRWVVTSMSTPSLYDITTSPLGTQAWLRSDYRQVEKAFFYNASTEGYTEETTPINNAYANDAVLPPNQTETVGDAIYYGSAQQFSEIRVNVGTAGVYSGITLGWQYWNGSSWVALSNVVDRTEGFKKAGTNSTTYNVPTDWTTGTVNGYEAFWIRCNVTSMSAPSITTAPLGTQAWLRSDYRQVEKAFFYNTGTQTYTDETAPINNPVANDVDLPPKQTTTFGDAIYSGSAQQFSEIRVNVSTAGNYRGKILEWQYWNGLSWTALSNVKDGTDGFKNTGTNTITYNMPADWKTRTVNGYEAFWIRCVVIAAPLASQAWLSLSGDRQVEKAFFYNASAGTYTDETVDINDADANDVNLPPKQTTTVGDAVYFGAAQQFPSIRVNVGAAGVYSGITLEWQYWNGLNWAALSSVTDGTDGFKNAGTNNIIYGYWGGWPPEGRSSDLYIDTVTMLYYEDPTLAFPLFLTDDADTQCDSVYVPRMYVPDLEDEPGVRTWPEMPMLVVCGNMMGYDPEETSIYLPEMPIGTTKHDLFSDYDFRLGMAHLVDHDAYIAAAFVGEAVWPNSIIIDGLKYQNPDQETYPYDLNTALDHFKLAWGGQVYSQGFKVQLIYNTGNLMRQKFCEMLEYDLEVNLKALDPSTNFQADVTGLPWSTVFRFAMYTYDFADWMMGWQADFPDADSFVRAFMHSHGGIAQFQRIQYGQSGMKQKAWDLRDWGLGTFGNPALTIDNDYVDTLIDKAALIDDSTSTGYNIREQIYYHLQEIYYKECASYPVYQPAGRHWEREWVQGWYCNQISPYGEGPSGYFYHMWKGWCCHGDLDFRKDTVNGAASLNYLTCDYLDLFIFRNYYRIPHWIPGHRMRYADYNNDKSVDYIDLGRFRSYYIWYPQWTLCEGPGKWHWPPPPY